MKKEQELKDDYEVETDKIRNDISGAEYDVEVSEAKLLCENYDYITLVEATEEQRQVIEKKEMDEAEKLILGEQNENFY